MRRRISAKKANERQEEHCNFSRRDGFFQRHRREYSTHPKQCNVCGAICLIAISMLFACLSSCALSTNGTCMIPINNSKFEEKSSSSSSSSSSPWCQDVEHKAIPGMYGEDTINVDLIGQNKGAFGQYIDLPDDMETIELFQQGITQLWGFNNVEAHRNFRTAVSVSPECALCWWGVAACFSPNINYSIENQTMLNEAIGKAVNLAKSQSHLNEKSRVLIEAYSKLVIDPPPERDNYKSEERKEWARTLCSKSIDDDIDALCAGAIMANSPWNYYLEKKSGVISEMKPEITPAKDKLLSIMNNESSSNDESASIHLLAAHLLIHLLEPTNAPGSYRWLALPAARTLSTSHLSQGHLTHMPSHIFFRTGHYAEGISSSQRALKNNIRYLKSCLKPYAYGHNMKMLVANAILAGKKKLALTWSKELSSGNYQDAAGEQITPNKKLVCVDCAGIGSPHVMTTLLRFGDGWNDILKKEKPEHWGSLDLKQLNRALYHMARAMSYYSLAVDCEMLDQDLVNMGDDERATMMSITRSKPIKRFRLVQNHFELEVNATRSWKIERDYDRAIDHMKKLVVEDDSVRYLEPPHWYYPPRHCLGSMLVKNNEAEEALKVFEKDLYFNPNNAWSLHGMADALELLERQDEAKVYRNNATISWSGADLDFVSPCPQIFSGKDKVVG